MKVFLSYSSQDAVRAEEIALALQGQGVDVFFDKSDLTGGEDFHARIQERVQAADLFVFLITPQSVREGAYSLSELRLAREKWQHPKNHVLPVLLKPTPFEDIPVYLKGVTIFKPEGNAAAEVASQVTRSRRRVSARLAVTGIVLAAALLLLLVPLIKGVLFPDDPGPQDPPDQPFTSKIEAAEFVPEYTFRPDQITRTEYSLDPASEFPVGDGDVLTLARLEFGRVERLGLAFAISLRLSNTSDRPITLDLTTRFFELADDQGQVAELVYFSGGASGEFLGPKEEREMRLVYLSQPGWYGKQTRPTKIYLRVSGLLPVIRAAWEFRPLPTAP